MCLVLRIPRSESETLEVSCCKFQVRQRPETRNLSFDLVERLIGSAAELPDVRRSIDEQPVSSHRRRFMRQGPTGCSMVIQHSWASKRWLY